MYFSIRIFRSHPDIAERLECQLMGWLAERYDLPKPNKGLFGQKTLEQLKALDYIH